MPLLQLEGVSKRFGRVVVADEVTFQLEEGTSMGVLGPNGAGKTSLFGIISGDTKQDDGSVHFDGRSLGSMTAPARCRLGVGRTYQIPQPFEHMTAFENALLAAQPGSRGVGASSRGIAWSGAPKTPRARASSRDEAATLAAGRDCGGTY